MICPHCLVGFHEQRELQFLLSDANGMWCVESYECSECKKAIFYLLNADVSNRQGKLAIVQEFGGKELVTSRVLIRPQGISRAPIPKEVPSNIAQDYREASQVLVTSPKASAALSRRCLQNILRDAGKVKHADLYNEIQEVITSGHLPSYIADGIDSIRNIGNFSAHPLKSKTTGAIVDVEPGEAEWTLDVLETLFDHYYVQPAVIAARREALNKKLADLGKPPMK